MGVWIETLQRVVSLPLLHVTPCMGVWIETVTVAPLLQRNASHPVWVCGLKLAITLRMLVVVSHTLYGCVD